MNTITLEYGEILQDKYYTDSVEIYCKGSNVIKGCQFTRSCMIKSIDFLRIEDSTFQQILMKEQVMINCNQIEIFNCLLWDCRCLILINGNQIKIENTRIEQCIGDINSNDKIDINKTELIGNEISFKIKSFCLLDNVKLCNKKLINETLFCGIYHNRPNLIMNKCIIENVKVLCHNVNLALNESIFIKIKELGQNFLFSKCKDNIFDKCEFVDKPDNSIKPEDFNNITHNNKVNVQYDYIYDNLTLKKLEIKEQKKVEVNGQCCCHKLVKAMKLLEKLNQYSTMFNQMGQMSKEIKEIMKEINR